MNQFLKKSSLFLFLAAGIYACYLVSAVYHEKLLKKPYKSTQTGKQAYCSESLIFTIFPPFVAYIIGQINLWIKRQNKVLPWKKCAVISGIINFNMFTYNQAVVYASFPAVVMAKSCSLLSVIIVGVFFSRVKDSKLKLTHQKLLIGFVATIGIIVFNFFKKQEKDAVDQPLSLFSIGNLYLILSLIGDGFLPDFQAVLKSQYKPSTMQMYCQINKSTFIIGFLLALFTFRVPTILDFIINYQSFAADLIMLSILNAVGQLFIYRMIKQFRQHIPAFVIAFRKCLTVIINILWFNHAINTEQMSGILLVFLAVFWEVISNYREGKKKEEDKSKFSQISSAEAPQLQNEKNSTKLLEITNDTQMVDEQIKIQEEIDIDIEIEPQLIENKS